MWIASLFFAFWRLSQIFTLIPVLGMLAWFVHGYVVSQSLTPDFILVLFIASVLATVWAIYTLFAHDHTTHSSFFIAFIDLCFLGTFIASAWELRNFGKADCGNLNQVWVTTLGVFGVLGYQTRSPWAADLKKNCAMLKACFAFAIMNCFFWLFTAWFLLFMHKPRPVEKVVVEKRGHRHRRRRSGGHQQTFV
ncbi:MAG: hypothetical protein M1839_007413 [Geoglossum umbratile]|nr:MAG: hypothetical protein M1839_007413 [Geoglossum umbratile]